jgi:hypothetical protein
LGNLDSEKVVRLNHRLRGGCSVHAAILDGNGAVDDEDVNTRWCDDNVILESTIGRNCLVTPEILDTEVVKYNKAISRFIAIMEDLEFWTLHFKKSEYWSTLCNVAEGRALRGTPGLRRRVFKETGF